MKKKLIVLSILLGVALIGLIGTTVAWLTSTGSETIDFTMGQVVYTIETQNTTIDTVVPGQNLFEDNANSVIIKNKSNVTTQLRVKIDITTKNSSPDLSDFIIELSGWKIGNDGYWYYGDTDGDNSAVISVSTNLTEGIVVSFPLNLTLDGTKIGNSFAGHSYSITITFEAKQSEHVKWSDMGSIDFSTGLAKTN